MPTVFLWKNLDKSDFKTRLQDSTYFDENEVKSMNEIYQSVLNIVEEYKKKNLNIKKLKNNIYQVIILELEKIVSTFPDTYSLDNFL